MQHRKPNRLKGYDYSTDNLYFITSCVHEMICCFGDIVAGTGHDLSLQPQMILNEYGNIAHRQWYWLFEQYPYIVSHEFIVMPNHIHGIIEILRTGRDLSLKIKSLSELMGAYKTTVSKNIHFLGYAGFAWQRSFYDHIIRDEKSYETISNYIMNNANSWDQDKFFKQK